MSAPSSAQLVCDFCSTPNPRWSYPTKDFTSAYDGFDVELRGGWAACDECKRLIDHEDRIKLVDRAMDGFLADKPRLDRSTLYLYRERIWNLHDDFMMMRCGDPQPLTQADEADLGAVQIRIETSSSGEEEKKAP